MPADAASKPEILVVEDDDQTAHWMRIMLEADGWSVRHAANGKAARAAIGKTPPPWLVTLDVGLPDTSGVELILQIKEAPGWERVPIVMVTATPKDENVNWAIKSGAKAYLVKPFKPEELQATVKRLARKPG
jgi:two-component system, OmpR family, alkaline phosphatase synthesis response regulator PhoP